LFINNHQLTQKSKSRLGKIPKAEDNSYNKQQISLVSLSWLLTGTHDNLIRTYIYLYIYTIKSGFLLQTQNSDSFHKIFITQEDIISVLMVTTKSLCSAIVLDCNL